MCTLSCLLLSMIAAAPSTEGAGTPDQWGLKPGKIELTSAGAMTFGPDGILFVGDTVAGAVYAIKTNDDQKESFPAKLNIKGLSSKLAEVLGGEEADVKVNDLAISPANGTIYLSVAAGKPAQPAIVKINSSGKLSKVSLEAPHSHVVLTDVPDSQKGGRRGDPRDDAITDLAFREGKLLVAGLAKGQSPSTVRQFTFPFNEGSTQMSIEIYHAAHGRVEDNAAVRTFVPFVINGEPSLLAGFTCTPLVSFPVKGLETGAKVRGTTVAELGNRNRPLDMIVYEKDGQSFVLMANSARGVMKINLANIQENPGLTEPVKGGGTAGQPFETIKDLEGVEQLALLDEAHAIILTKSEKGSLDLGTVELP